MQRVLMYGLMISVGVACLGTRPTYAGSTTVNFTFEGRSAYIIIPDSHRSDKPWIWRSRWPGFYTAHENALVNNHGFHVAYLDLGGWFGSPNSVTRWTSFYNHLRATYGLHEKPSIRCVSRGGLHAYNWAEENTNKVSSIIGISPVLDFKSWPGGYGKFTRSASNWNTCKSAYGFANDAAAVAWTGNPVDTVSAIATAGIPLLHYVWTGDTTVYYDENSQLMTNNFPALDMTLVVGAGGSHQSKPSDPQPLIDFVLASLPAGTNVLVEPPPPGPGDLIWSDPVSITSDSVVSTNGVLIEAVDGTSSSTPARSNLTVNGVTFVQATAPRDDFTQHYYDAAVYRGSGVSGDFAKILDDDIYSATGGEGGNEAVLTLTGLTTGSIYLFQMFCCENRNSVTWSQKVRGGARTSETVTDGGNGGAIALSGTFTATNTTQSLHFTEVAGAVWWNAFQVRTLPPEPSIVTLPPSNEDISEADMNFDLISDGMMDTTVFMYWGTANGGTDKTAWSNAWGLGVLSVGSDTYHATNLSPETTYSYRAYATNALGDSWAPTTETLTTLSLDPVIDTLGASSITFNSADLLGELVSTGGMASAVSVYWGPTQGGTDKAAWSNETTLAGLQSEGPVSVAVSNLLEETTYHFRYYASNTYGEAWADSTTTFTTMPSQPPIPPANIEWEAPVSVTSDSIVNTNGTLVEAVDGISDWTPSYATPARSNRTVNGVTFVQRLPPREDFGQCFYSTAVFRGTGVSSGFADILDDDIYSSAGGAGGSEAVLTLAGLTAGRDYLFQMFCCENRTSVTWSQRVRGGDNTSATITDGGNGGATSITGRFTADGPTMDLYFTEISGSVWWNAFQVRDVSPRWGTVFILR